MTVAWRAARTFAAAGTDLRDRHRRGGDTALALAAGAAWRLLAGPVPPRRRGAGEYLVDQHDLRPLPVRPAGRRLADLAAARANWRRSRPVAWAPGLAAGRRGRVRLAARRCRPASRWCANSGLLTDDLGRGRRDRSGRMSCAASLFPLAWMVFLIPFGEEFEGPLQTITAKMSVRFAPPVPGAGDDRRRADHALPTASSKWRRRVRARSS